MKFTEEEVQTIKAARLNVKMRKTCAIISGVFSIIALALIGVHLAGFIELDDLYWFAGLFIVINYIMPKFNTDPDYHELVSILEKRIEPKNPLEMIIKKTTI